MAERVLVTGARAPVALHLARLLHQAGIEVYTADTPVHALTRGSRCVAGHFSLPPPVVDPRRYGHAVRDLVSRLGVSHVIPTCEEVFWLAFVWRDSRPNARLLAPTAERLAAAHDKHRFILDAFAAGIATPRTDRLNSSDALRPHVAQSRSKVFKPVFSRFARHTLVRPAPAQLASIRPTPSRPWVAQDFVEGQEICVHAAAFAGRITALAAYCPRYRAGKGAGIWFDPVDDAGVADTASRYASATGWTGHLSFDCIRQPDGKVIPIECNPRPTSGLHFFRDGAAYAAALLEGTPTATPATDRPLTIPLAMWIYGLAKAVRRGEISAFRSDLTRASDALDWPGDPLPLGRQARLVLEFAGVALRRRVSLQEASTFDIEWNGEPVSTA